ncbi:hypothetical protein D3C72_1736180 [compost metagenome]
MARLDRRHRHDIAPGVQHCTHALAIVGAQLHTVQIAFDIDDQAGFERQVAAAHGQLPGAQRQGVFQVEATAEVIVERGTLGIGIALQRLAVKPPIGRQAGAIAVERRTAPQAVHGAQVDVLTIPQRSVGVIAPLTRGAATHIDPKLPAIALKLHAYSNVDAAAADTGAAARSRPVEK